MSFTRQIGTAESTKTFERSEEAFAKSRPGPGVEGGAGFDKKARAKRRGVCEITAAPFAPAPRAGGEIGGGGFKPPTPRTPLGRLTGRPAAPSAPDEPQENKMLGIIGSLPPF